MTGFAMKTMNSLSDISKKAEQAVKENHQRFLDENKPTPRLRLLNASALQRFDALKFPHKTHEMYTYVDLKELISVNFSYGNGKRREVDLELVKKHVYASCANSVITLVDGIFRHDLSHLTGLGSHITLRSFDDALSHSEFKKYILGAIEKENDVFSSINGIFLKEGLVIEVRPNTSLKSPLQILQLSTGSNSNPVASTPRIFLKAGRMSDVKIIVKFVGEEGNCFVNSVLDILIEEGATVRFSQVQADNKDSWHFSKNRVFLHRYGRFLAANASWGSKLARHHYEVRLREEGSEVRFHGLSVLKDREQVHNYIRVCHEAPRCTSRLHCKNVIHGRGHSSVDGTVIVDRGAHATFSNQLIKNLLLSDTACADNKPNLMIHAEDVKCTHGATVGQLNKDQLFYLKTRGFSPERAKSILTTGFAREIINAVEFPDVIEDLNHTLLEKLETCHV